MLVRNDMTFRVTLVDSENPLSHVQLGCPEALLGQDTSMHVELKKGNELMETTEPVKPGLQVHPAVTVVPVLFAGHLTAEQLVV